MAFPAGDINGGSSLTLLLCILGVWQLWRTRHRVALLLLLLGPALLHFVAAAMERYPYGAHPRFAMPQAPAICLLAGIGLAWATGLPKRPRGRAI